jgi:hypothetical protein
MTAAAGGEVVDGPAEPMRAGRLPAQVEVLMAYLVRP